MKYLTFCIAIVVNSLCFAADGPVMDSDNPPQRHVEIFQSIPAMTIIVPMDDDGANQVAIPTSRVPQTKKHKKSTEKTKSLQMKTEVVL